jgi:hypothetical protein
LIEDKCKKFYSGIYFLTVKVNKMSYEDVLNRCSAMSFNEFDFLKSRFWINQILDFSSDVWTDAFGVLKDQRSKCHTIFEICNRCRARAPPVAYQ